MLPEIIVATVVMAMIGIALSSAVVVTMRQRDETEGRLNVARAEQAIGVWLPRDLASASTVDTDPGAVPCEIACPVDADFGGSNTIQVSWESTREIAGVPTTGTTTVSYRYRFEGGEYRLVRVACESHGTTTCRQNVVLHELLPPPSAFSPGVDAPTWVIDVSEPLDPCAASAAPSASACAEEDDGPFVKDARRVVVTIDGGGPRPGRGGGVSRVEITAGGTRTADLEANSISGMPSFTESESRCSGAIALLIDQSQSVTESDHGNPALVRAAVLGVVDVLAGTPIELQIVEYGARSSVLGGGNEWSTYFDMSSEDEVAELRSELADPNAFRPAHHLDDDGVWVDGHSNWEDALARVFYGPDGDLVQLVPDLVVLVTDGVPDSHRLESFSGIDFRAGSGPAPTTPARLPSPFTNTADVNRAYDHEGRYRAEAIAADFRGSVDFIGVGVDGVDSTVAWLDDDGSVVSTATSTVLARLVTGGDHGVEIAADLSNASTADLYPLGTWSELSAALEVIAEARCGGTLTVQTRLVSGANGTPVGEMFAYENTALWSDVRGGASVDVARTVVSTSGANPAANFDRAVPASQGQVVIDVEPQHLAPLAAYSFSHWECAAGPVSRSFDAIPIDGSQYEGVSVVVGAHESVSCVMFVTN